MRTVDDMFTLITLLDQNKSLDILPVYVASGPDRFPGKNSESAQFQYFAYGRDSWRSKKGRKFFGACLTENGV